MSEIVNTATIKVVADASGVEAGLRPVDDAVAKTGKNLENLGATAKSTGKAIEEAGRGPGLSGVGEGASTAATKVDRATKNMSDSIRRAIDAQTALAAGAKGTAENYAALANVRGVNVEALKPLLAQLDEAKRKADLAADAQRRLDDSTKFLSDLKSRADGIGKTASQLAEMRAAQLGVADAAGPMIAKLREAENAGEGSFGKLGDMAGKLKTAVLGLAVGAAAAGAALTAMVNSALDDLGELDDMAQKTGSSVESLSKIQKIDTVFGPGMGAVSGALDKLSKGMATADDETNKTQKALAALGVSAKDSADKLRDPSEVLVDVAKKLQGYNDGAAKTALITDLIGKSGAELLPFLNDLAENYDKVSGVSAEAAGSAASFQDQLGWMKLRFKELFTAVTIDALPALNDLAGAFLDVYNNQKEVSRPDTKQWADDIGQAIAQAADAAAMLGRGIAVVWNSLKAVRADINLMSTVQANSNPVNVGYKLATGGSPLADIKKAFADRNKVVEDANKTLDELMSKPLPEFEKAFLARLAARKQGATAGADDEPPKRDLKYTTGNDPAVKEAEAAAKKEVAAYASVTTAIQSKIEENRLEVAVGQAASESQKLQIKVDQELASGKLKLSDGHKQVVDAKLAELAASEELVKAQQAEKDSMAWMQQSAQARNAANNTLATEYALYGQSADARQLAMVSVKAEADLEKFLADERRKGINIGEELEAQLRAERDMRVEVEQATLAQTKALGYANQLADENKKFGIQYIADEKQRAAAQLALDAEVWQERIRLAGEGTEAQRILQQNYDTWYQNQSAKPFLDEQKRTWDGIGSAAHETFLSIENGAKSAADRAKQALKNGLYEWIWQVAMKPIYLDIRAAFTSSGASIPGMIDGSTSGAGAVGGNSLISAANAASSIYKAISGGFESVGSSVADAVQAGLYQTGLTQNIASNGAVANAAGTAASYGSGMLAGHYIGNAIAGDYSVAHGQTVTNIASVAGALIGGPIGGAIGGAIGGLINRAFGMGSKETVTTGIKGTLSSDGATASSYSTWHQDGGWFRSDKNGTDSKALSSDVTAVLTNGLAQMKAVSSSFADSLGVDAAAIANYSKTFNIDLGKDGKIEDGITKLLTSVGDELATTLVPSIMQFAKTGESAATVLERLAGDFNATTSVAQLIGKTAAQAFGTVGIESAYARERLVDLAGSASNLTSLASSYAQNFLTEGERLAPVAAAVDEAMSSLGLSWVTTREQFKQVVDSLDLTSQSGAETFTSLMQLSEAFAQVHAASDKLTKTESAIADERRTLQDQLDQLTMTSAELLAKQRDALDASNQSLFDQVQAAQKVKDAQDAAKTSLGDFITKMKSFSETAAGLNNSLALGDLSTLTPEQQYIEARKQFEATRQAAAAGDATAQGNLQSIEQTFLQLSMKLNAGDAQYSSDLATVMRTNDELSTWAASSVDVAQASLDALNNSSASLTDISATLTQIAQGVQYLPAVLTGQDTSTTTPTYTIDYSQYGTGGSVALAEEVKALRALVADLVTEAKGRRADAQKQSDGQITAGAVAARQAAEVVVDGMKEAATDAAWAAANSKREPT